MLKVTVVALAAITLAGGCGAEPGTPGNGDGLGHEDSGNQPAPAGLSLSASWEEALVAGEPVSWLLTVTNDGPPVTLVFSSGQQGDVVLTGDDGREAYRWSEGRGFTEALVEEPLDAGASATFELAEEQLEIEPGTYRLTATVPSDPSPAPLHQTVTVG